MSYGIWGCSLIRDWRLRHMSSPLWRSLRRLWGAFISWSITALGLTWLTDFDSSRECIAQPLPKVLHCSPVAAGLIRRSCRSIRTESSRWCWTNHVGFPPLVCILWQALRWLMSTFRGWVSVLFHRVKTILTRILFNWFRIYTFPALVHHVSYHYCVWPLIYLPILIATFWHICLLASRRRLMMTMRWGGLFRGMKQMSNDVHFWL